MPSVIILAVTIGTIGAILLAVLVYLLAIRAQDGIDRTRKAYKINGCDVHLSKPDGYVSPKGGR